MFIRSPHLPRHIVVESAQGTRTDLHRLRRGGIELQFVVGGRAERYAVAAKIGHEVTTVRIEFHAVREVEDITHTDVCRRINGLRVVMSLFIRGTVVAVELRLTLADTHRPLDIEGSFKVVASPKTHAVVGVLAVGLGVLHVGIRFGITDFAVPRERERTDLRRGTEYIVAAVHIHVRPGFVALRAVGSHTEGVHPVFTRSGVDGSKPFGRHEFCALINERHRTQQGFRERLGVFVHGRRGVALLVAVGLDFRRREDFAVLHFRAVKRHGIRRKRPFVRQRTGYRDGRTVRTDQLVVAVCGTRETVRNNGNAREGIVFREGEHRILQVFRADVQSHLVHIGTERPYLVDAFRRNFAVARHGGRGAGGHAAYRTRHRRVLEVDLTRSEINRYVGGGLGRRRGFCCRQLSRSRFDDTQHGYVTENCCAFQIKVSGRFHRQGTVRFLLQHIAVNIPDRDTLADFNPVARHIEIRHIVAVDNRKAADRRERRVIIGGRFDALVNDDAVARNAQRREAFAQIIRFCFNDSTKQSAVHGTARRMDDVAVGFFQRITADDIARHRAAFDIEIVVLSELKPIAAGNRAENVRFVFPVEVESAAFNIDGVVARIVTVTAPNGAFKLLDHRLVAGNRDSVAVNVVVCTAHNIHTAAQNGITHGNVVFQRVSRIGVVEVGRINTAARQQRVALRRTAFFRIDRDVFRDHAVLLVRRTVFVPVVFKFRAVGVQNVDPGEVRAGKRERVAGNFRPVPLMRLIPRHHTQFLNAGGHPLNGEGVARSRLALEVVRVDAVLVDRHRRIGRQFERFRSGIPRSPESECYRQGGFRQMIDLHKT